MKSLLILSFVIISAALPPAVFAQGLHSTSSRAVKEYNDGMASYDYLDYNNAEKSFNDAISLDNRFYEAYMMLGELYSKEKKFGEAAISYLSAVKLDSLFYKPVYFSLANAEMMSEDYSNALIHYKTYLRYNSTSEKNRLISVKNIKNCEFAIEALKKPLPFNPESVGSGINTTDDEYWPSITADGHTLMFTRQSKINMYPSSMSNSQEDFYVSFYSGNGWDTAVNAGEPLNTRQNEGAQTLSSNGDYMYFTACDRPGGLGSCDLFFSAFRNGRWTLPVNVGAPVNTSSWESTPSISADGNLLFFSSTRPGGSGGKDLWLTVMTKRGKWGTPVNLGKTINTEGDEMSPFIHFDGRTLYFASDGRPGMGGFDIYMTRMNDDTTWTEPQNLGYPINSSSDEMGLVIDATGQKAYFSSKRDNNNGKDIFFFNLDESIRPTPVSYIKGKVVDRETGKLLKADYELINLSTNRISVKNTTDDEGNFLVCLPSGYNYGINVTRPGYLFYSENFMFEGEHSAVKPLIKRISLNPAKVGETMLLSNVFFEIDSWELKKESIEELNNLTDLLAYNKNLIVEIGGYTDSTGTDNYNLVLSEKRALSVVSYLISKGIEADRLKYKGYGNTSPIGDNITSEGRRLNRRTEVKILGRKK
jgi:hypothetical protein